MTNLKAWFTAERAWYGERSEYRANFATIGFSPQGFNRYLYTDDPLGPVAGEWSSERYTTVLPHYPGGGQLRFVDVPAKVAGGEIVGITGQCPYCRASAVCVAQLDDDDEVDVWSISTVDRIDELTGTAISAGVPFHERADRHPRRALPDRWLP